MKPETNERIREHYLLGKRMAQRIRTSPRECRTQVAIEAYNELFTKIPWHSQLNDSAEKRRKRLEKDWLQGSSDNDSTLAPGKAFISPSLSWKGPGFVSDSGERLAARVRRKQVRVRLCKLLRAVPIYIIARKQDVATE